MKTYPKTANYTISQDPGTNSIGHAAIDNQTLKLLNLKHRKTIGAYTYKLGINPKTHDSTKKEAGFYRRGRRTKSRSDLRVNEVKRRFAPELQKGGYNILQNNQVSNVPSKDKPDYAIKYQDVIKNSKYPTISHAIQAAKNPNQKMALDLLYAIFKYQMKHRGNFNDETPANRFNVHQIDIEQAAKQINQAYQQLNNNQTNIIKISTFKELASTIIKNNLNTTKLKQTFKNQISSNHSFETNLINALNGNDFAFDKLANLNIKDRQIKKLYKINFASSDFDETKAEFESLLESDSRIIFETILDLYNNFKTQEILGQSNSISEANIERYKLHQHQLELLKSLKSVFKNGEYQKLIRTYYQWIGHDKKKSRIKDYEKFETIFNNVLINYKKKPAAKELLDAFENHQAFLTHRGAHNMNIPHQLHQLELHQIIEAQGNFYPFLKETDPFNPNEYILESIFASIIAYYIGPLTTKEEQLAQNQKPTAWAVRKDDYKGPITPWNWQYVLDVAKTAQAFIENSIAIDSHYYGQKVMPKSSLSYQLFAVLDEINKMQINHHRLEPMLKMAIINDLFKTRNTVTTKALTDYLKKSKRFNESQIIITGLSNPTQFNNQLSTYNRFKKIIGEKIDEPKYQNDLEEIANYLSIFPTSQVAKTELTKFTWLTDKEQTELSRLSYNGYSKMSKIIVEGIKDQDDKTLLTAMQTSSITLQSWLSQPFVAKQLNDHNQAYLKNNPKALEKLIQQAPTKVQKVVNKSARIIDETVQANGGIAPNRLVLETTRSPENTNEIPLTKIKQLQNLYTKLPKQYQSVGDFLNEYSKNGNTLTKKQYLYFKQGGLDFYNQESINWNQLNNYQIDHIIPQSVIKDDSLDNLVLTKSTTNHQKSDQYAYEFCGERQSDNWKELNQIGLISNRMLKNLFLTHETLDNYTKMGFINRQLNEVSQSVKLIIAILSVKLPNTQIIRVNGKMNHQLRDYYGFKKIREENNNHHAHDAYFNAIIGNYLMDNYPNLQPLFVNGEYMHNLNLKDMQQFNFLHGLNPQKKSPNAIQTRYQNTLKTYGTYVYYASWIKNVVETYDNQGQFHNENAVKHSQSASLTPFKQGQNPGRQGGYNGNHNKYSYIIAITKRTKSGQVKNTEVYLGGMPMAFAPIAEKLNGQALDDYIIKVYLKKYGKKYNPKDMSVIVRHVPNQTLIESFDMVFRLSSSEYIQAGESIVLSPSATKMLDETFLKTQLKNNHLTTTELQEQFSQVYDEIIEKLQKYIKLYNGKTVMKRLIENKSAFMELNDFDKVYKPSKFQMLTNFNRTIKAKTKNKNVQLSLATQHVLDEKELKELVKNADPNQLEQQLNNAFDELNDIANQYNIKLLHYYTKDKFKEAEILKNQNKNSKVYVLKQLLASTLPNNQIEKIPELGITNSFGLIQKKDMRLSNNFALIYESPAGLNTRIKHFHIK